MIDIRNASIDLPGFSLREVSLSVKPGEFFILMGPTGSGKTLTLEAIAGVAPLSGGRIVIDGRDVTNLPPEKRGVGIVYQDYALFPHLTVIENIRYGLPYHRADRDACAARIAELVRRLGIAALARRSVTHLSGGEKQRVALARALAVNPAVLLLDEPLSALDAGFRDEIQRLLKELHETMNVTFLMVTHDFTEALFLGDRVAVINKGRIAQVGDAEDVFLRPQTPFVARFTGVKNVMEADVAGDRAALGGVTLQVSPNGLRGRRHLAIRAEDIRIQAGPPPDNPSNVFQGRVADILDRGPFGELTVTVQDQAFTVFIKKSELTGLRRCDGRRVSVIIPPSAIHIM